MPEKPAGPELPRFSCGCGFEGTVFQVAAHKGRHKDAKKWPDCQGGYLPSEQTPAAATSELAAEPMLERSNVHSNGLPLPEVAAPVEAIPPESDAIRMTGAIFTYKESVAVSPVLRTLWNTLKLEEGLDYEFAAWLEQSCLRYWKGLGYEVAVVISSPDKKMTAVNGRG